MTHAIFICIAHLLLDIAVEQYSFISDTYTCTKYRCFVQCVTLLSFRLNEEVSDISHLELPWYAIFTRSL